MLLAIDTATSKIGIALYDGVEVLHEAVWLSPYRHTVELAPAIEEALQHTSLSMDDLEAIGLAIGPGSYTGLRIGRGAAYIDNGYIYIFSVSFAPSSCSA